MQDEPPTPPPSSFDHGKASFWLVAFVIGWLLFMCAAYLGACLIYHDGACKDSSATFYELLQTILASALAFGAGRSIK